MTMFAGNSTMSSLSPVIAYDDASKIFFNDDKTIGFGFVCQPLPGGNEETEKQLQTFLALDFPEGTTISFMLFRSPDIDAYLNHMIMLRGGYYDKLLTPLLYDRTNFLREHSQQPLITERDGSTINCGLIVDVKLFITVKLPVSNGINPKNAEIEATKDLQRRSYSALKDIGFCPSEMSDIDFTRIMGTLVNWSDSATWKQNYVRPDMTQPLCDQFYDPNSDLDDTEPTRSFIRLGQRLPTENNKSEKLNRTGETDETDYNCYVQVLSPRQYPTGFYFGDAMMFSGDATGRGRSTNISGNYAIVSTIKYINHTQTYARLIKKRSLTQKAAFAPILLKARPELADAIRDYDEMYNSVKDGAHLVLSTFQVILFAKSKQRLIDMSQAMIQYFAILNFKLMPDKYIQRELFQNCLPFSVDEKFMFGFESRRYQTFTNDIVTVLLPIFADWKGTGTGHVALISRTGQIMTLSLNDSDTNNNALIAAESGSGKSFYTNELMTMYMSEGARVFIIDIGRSYLKLCNILHGEFIVFNPDNLPCLNPFRMIKDINEEHDTIIQIIAGMIADKEPLTDQQNSVLSRIFDELWAQYKQTMTVDMVEQALFEYAEKNNDMRIRDMATQLYKYTMKGPYGKVFSGDNPISFNSSITVLELEELAAFPDLRRVVLMQLIFQIQQAIFLSPNRDQRKIVMIDEAWDLLKEGNTSKFMEAAYRKFRKYGASAIIATQAISDLYNSADNNIGQAIAQNSAFFFLLGQKAQTVEQVKEKKQMTMSDGAFELLKTVHTVKGVFSEIFIQSNRGTGIGRLIVSDFEKLMFSTDAKDIQRINYYVNQGATYSQAITQILIDDGKKDISEVTDKQQCTFGEIMTEEQLKEYMNFHSVVITDDTIKKFQTAYWSPTKACLVFADGSNIVNYFGEPVGVIFETEDKVAKEPLITLKEAREQYLKGEIK